MRYGKILAGAAALCMTFGISLPTNYIESIVSYAEVTKNGYEFIFDNVGDYVQIEFDSQLYKAYWSSGDYKVATVNVDPDDPTKITITAVGVGKTYVMATTDTGIALDQYDITVLNEGPETQEISVLIGRFTLNNQFSKASLNIRGVDSKDVEWSSTDESIATVDNEGNVKAVGRGECVINGINDGVRYYAEVVSEYGEPVRPFITEIFVGDIELSDAVPARKVAANAPEGTVLDWWSSDEKVAKVSDDGMITATGSGSCFINADANGNRYIFTITSTYTGTTSSTETYSELTIHGVGNTSQLSTTGMDGDINFSSSDTSIVTVDEKGLVTAVAEGEAIVTADNGKTKAKIKVTVEPAVKIGDANLDTKVTVADAVAILQSIANKDKYALKPLGAINADVDGEKGVTAKDALVIQQFDARVVTSLPIKSETK